MSQQLKPINSSTKRVSDILGLPKEKEEGYLLDFISHYSSTIVFTQYLPCKIRKTLLSPAHWRSWIWRHSSSFSTWIEDSYQVSDCQAFPGPELLAVQRSVLQFDAVLSPLVLHSYILQWKLHCFEVEGCVHAGRAALLPPWVGKDNGPCKAGVQLTKVIKQWLGVNVQIAVVDKLSTWQVQVMGALLSSRHSGLRT